MTKVLLAVLLVLSLSVQTFATELTAPEVPPMGADRMPQNTTDFGAGLWELLEKSAEFFRPELADALELGWWILFAAVLFSIFPLLSEQVPPILSIAGALTIATLIFQKFNSMLLYATDAVQEICEYGKLLCPVLSMALAAQGGVTSSAALYTGTTGFIAILTMLISGVVVPMIYIFLILSVSYCALEYEVMKNVASAIKNFVVWLLKTLLIVFTTYMSLTRVISGTSDAALLKATKVTISSVVPVVGGILSDASESVLTSVGILKNAAGIYGILAILAVFMGPFLKVGVQFLLLKAYAGICCMLGNKNMSALVADFSTAMGLLLAVVASGCTLVLVSTTCFIKGIG